MGTIKTEGPSLPLRRFRPRVMVLRFLLPLSIAACLTLPLAVFSSKGLAPLFALTAVAAIAHFFIARRAFPPTPVRLGMGFATFLLLAGLSALWSLTPAQSFQAVWPLAGILFGITVLAGVARALDDMDRTQAQTALLGGFFVGLALMAIEAAFGFPVSRTGASLLNIKAGFSVWMLKPAATIAALLLWPTLVLLHRKGFRWPALLVVATGTVAIIGLIKSDAAILGLILGGAVFGLTMHWSRMMGPALGAILAVLMISAPWVPMLFPDPRISMTGIEYLPNSAVHRILIWQTTAEHIHKRPWLGHGFDTSRSLYPSGTSKTVHFARPTIGKSGGVAAEPIPLHPHNMALQIWLELGAIGAGIALAAPLAMVAAVSRARLERMEQAASYGFLVTVIAIAVVAYGAWQAWWLSAIGLCGALFVAVLSRSPKTA